jgi:hypothetical protein
MSGSQVNTAPGRHCRFWPQSSHGRGLVLLDFTAAAARSLRHKHVAHLFNEIARSRCHSTLLQSAAARRSRMARLSR